MAEPLSEHPSGEHPTCCPRCSSPLLELSAYCTACGAAILKPGLESTLQLQPAPCPACGRDTPPAARFCATCGTRLPPRSGALLLSTDLSPDLTTTDERRVVTVLHADLCGFTRLAERLDPEQTRALVQALFLVLTQEILELGGRVEACIGDAILAVFGAPVSHGDDPRRAVDAALAIHRVLSRFSHPILMLAQASLQMRIGVDTGAVVVGRLGASQKQTITGATVASAMALERSAPHGYTLVGEQAARAILQDYQLEPMALPNGKPAFLLKDRLARLESVPIAGPRWQQDQETGGDRIQAQARIDRLGLFERRLLKLAAIAGAHFWVELLERLGFPEPHTGLRSLETAGLITTVPHTSIPGTTEYRFLDEGVREVAMQNNLLKVRRFSHRVVAAWLEERLPGDLELLPRLVHHYVEGGDRLSAAQALISGAQRLAARHAFDEARQHYREAYEQLRWLNQLEEAGGAATTSPPETSPPAEVQTLLGRIQEALTALSLLTEPRLEAPPPSISMGWLSADLPSGGVS